jgi:hypothetical protein
VPGEFSFEIECHILEYFEYVQRLIARSATPFQLIVLNFQDLYMGTDLP